MPTLENELADLWADATLRFRKLKPSPTLRRALRAAAMRLHIDRFTRDTCDIFLRRDSKGRLLGAVFIAPQNRSTRRFVIFTRPGDRPSVNWAGQILSYQPLEKCAGRLEPWQFSLLPKLRRNGIAIRSVSLEGNVGPSLRRLRAHYGKSLREPLRRLGLTLEAARTRDDVEVYLRMLRAQYRRYPEFGPGVGNAEFLDYIRKDLLRGMKRGQKPLWLIRRGRKALGGADYVDFGKRWDGKRIAGFGINLASELQGKNLSRVIYETMLLELRSRGIELYRGLTGQPGVMRLGKIMSRRLIGAEVDRGIAKQFPARHFRSWL